MVENRQENSRNNLEKVTEVAKASLFALLLTLMSPGSGLAKDKEVTNDLRDAVSSASMSNMRDSIADYKTITEQLRLQIIKKQEAIKELANEEGKTIDINGQSAKQLVNKNGDIIILRDNIFEEGTWMSLTTPNKLTYLDSNGDGLPDSALIDQEKDNSENFKNRFAENLASLSLDLDMAAVMTGTYNPPTGKIRFDFKKENGEYVIEALDMKSGKRISLEGPRADEVMRDISKYYLEHLGSI